MAAFRQILQSNIIIVNNITVSCVNNFRNSNVLLYNQKAGMATLKAVKNRLKGVQSIQKITNSMKMVATSRMKSVKRERDRVEQYNKSVVSLINAAAAPTKEEVNKDDKIKSRLIVAVTTDKGLCGSVNSQVSRKVKIIVENSISQQIPIKIMTIVEKGKASLRRTCGQYIIQSFSDIGNKPASYVQACAIADFLSKQNDDEIILVYNKFVSAIKFDTIEIPIITKTRLFNQIEKFQEYEFDSDNFESVWEFYVASIIYNALLENATAEISAKASAMDNATKNAKEMINKLTLLKNRTRQALITKELSEIVSGKEALEQK